MSERSDRRSVRVESTSAITAGQPRIGSPSAPESMRTGGVAPAPASEGGRRLSQDELDQLRAQLSDRDRAVLSDLGAYGFLTSTQIQTLHFHTYDKQEVAARITRRDLLRLRRTGLIEPLDRRIGGLRAGSASYIWRLGLLGDRLLRDPDDPRARRKEPSLRFLEHRLAVAGTVCDLVTAARQGAFELLSMHPEPDTWRPFMTGYGAPEILKPDLFAITASGDFEDHWFIEVDRATESVPTVVGQCEQYERYRRSGTEQARVGLFPRVLWLVPDEHRRSRMRTAIARHRDLDDALFEVELQQHVASVIQQQTTKGGE